MADNIAVTPGSGALIAADEVGGAKYQRVKLSLGADGSVADLQAPADGLAAGVVVPAGNMLLAGAGTWTMERDASALGDAASSGLASAGVRLFNDTAGTWDRQRGNTSGTLLASAARTVQTVSANQTNYNARGVLITIRVTAKAASTQLGFNVAGLEGIGGQGYYLAQNASQWAAAVGDIYVFVVYPGVIDADLTNSGYLTTSLGVSCPLPRIWSFAVTPSDANSVTYSSTYNYVL